MGSWRIHFGPELTPDQCQEVREGRDTRGIPGGLASRQSCRGESRGQEQDEAEEPQQARRGARKRPRPPLPLRFDAQMATYFLKRHFDLPPAHVPGDDVVHGGGRIGAEEGTGTPFARWIAQQHPADGQRCFSIAVPERGAAGQVHREGLSDIPRQVFGLPHRGRVTEAVAQLRLPWPLLGFDAWFAFGLRWDGIVELGIEQQTRNQSDTVLATGESEAGGGEGAIAYE